MPKHFFFDLDKTLTLSRSPMEPDHQGIFERLCNAHDVIVVTGGTVEHIREQVTPRFEGKYYLLAQSGNHCEDVTGAELWREELSQAQLDAIYTFVEKLKAHFNFPVADPNDLVENRGAQVGYSVVGYHANIDVKYSFDPGDTKRAAALAAFPDDVQGLNAAGVEVVPAGTTSFNFIPLGKHKGFNIRRFIDLKEWKTDDCIYVGDALFPGGNDESVIGVVPTKAVTSPDDTFAYLKEVLG